MDAHEEVTSSLPGPVPDITSSTRKDWDVLLARSMANLMVIVPSPTIVFQAASYLIECGLFEISDVGIVIIKHIRAFLFITSWLQRLVLGRWIDAGDLPAPAGSTYRCARQA